MPAELFSRFCVLKEWFPVCRRFDNRFDSLKRIVPLCDEVIFYDNENGFIKVAEIKNNKFNYSNGYRPKWITEFENKLKLS